MRRRWHVALVAAVIVVALDGLHRRRRRPDAALRQRPTTASSSCSPSRCRPRPAALRLRVPGRLDVRRLRYPRGLARFWLDSDRGGVHAVEVSLRRRATPPARSRNPRRPTRPGMRVFVRPDSLEPSFTGDPVPAVRRADASATRTTSRAAPRRRSRSRRSRRCRCSLARTIVAEVAKDPGSSSAAPRPHRARDSIGPMLTDHRRALWYALALLASLGFVLFAVGTTSTVARAR